MTHTSVTHALENIVALAKDTIHDIDKSEMIMDKIDQAYLNVAKKDLNSVISAQYHNIKHHPSLESALVATVDYSTALRWAKEGFRIARGGWNGKGMWVIAEGLDTDTPYLTMRTVTGAMQPGWLPSQPDNFAEDWCVLYSRDHDLAEDTVDA